MAKFKTAISTGALPENPEALFRDLKGRSAIIKHLWSHQADVLRAYHTRYLKSSDVALQLPTGSGKTLVGLLIAEYRRIAHSDRVVYLCPTRQLAYQVGRQAHVYGVKAHVLVGPQANYDPSHYADYVTGKAIAVTTYSGVFNSNPKLEDANVLILDDAHAAENYVADVWTVSIDRLQPLYRELLELLAGTLSNTTVVRFLDDDLDATTLKWVDKAPFPAVWPLWPRIVELIESRLDRLGSLKHAWTAIRENLPACGVYVSWAEIAIRPIVPPTRTHLPFSGAKQRVYMSATLGQGGDLERIMGVPSIDKVPIPNGWEKQATGRRLMLFPDRSLSESNAMKAAIMAIGNQERSLVMCPDKSAQKRFIKAMEGALSGFSIMGAEAIEASLEPFISRGRACLVLTNRYDGLDLPDEACRLSVIYGLPSATNLQEKFLWSRLNATALLRERVRTRLTQAFGRCTRNDTDFSAIMLVGEELFDFCAKQENTAGMHPEIRAELKFGVENSEGLSDSDFLDLLNTFYAQDADWADANHSIVQLRNELDVITDDVHAALASTTRDEVEFSYALWAGDYGRAVELSRSVIERLAGDKLRGYRGWWCYLGGYAASVAASKRDPALKSVANDMFGRAATCAPSVRWLVDLAHSLTDDVTVAYPPITAAAIENSVNHIMSLGLTGLKFERSSDSLHQKLTTKDSAQFEQGLVDLGTFLGYQALKPEGNAAPDAIWRLGDQIFAFEAKSDATSDSVSVSTLRQARGHFDWVALHLKPDDKTNVSVMVISPQTKRDSDTTPFTGALLYQSVAEIQELARFAINALRTARSRSADRDGLSQELFKTLTSSKLTPSDLFASFIQRMVSGLPTL